jgi:hypothetical protein
MSHFVASLRIRGLSPRTQTLARAVPGPGGEQLRAPLDARDSVLSLCL